jgi:hypothetical protein
MPRLPASLNPIPGDLSDWNERYEFARAVERSGPLAPSLDHLALLKQSSWDWNDDEFGAASMSPKYPYGNSGVERDLAEHLPHLPEQDRLRVHCELPAVLAWICANENVLQAIAVEAAR